MRRPAVVALVFLSACDPAAPTQVSPRALEDGPSDLSHEPGAPRGMSPDVFETPGLDPLWAVPAPLPQAYCEINVEGVLRATETDYIPHVIQCENGGANFEALKAQAIAARSVAYYAMYNDGKICDSQGCQVYSCGAQPQQIHYDAAAATAGQYLSFNNWLTYGFYVAGDPQQPASCIDTDNANVSSTEKWVTFNEGKTLYDVDQTALGFIFPEDINVNGYGQNRGCMSQWGSRCLENTKGYDAVGILRFYYGADIQILQAQGPCVAPPNKPPEGNFEAADCTSGIAGWTWDPDQKDQAIQAHVSFLAPYGDPNAVTVTIAADQHREDLCQALGSCAHGLSLGMPRSLMDGQPHAVHLYGVDAGGGGHVELPGSPKEFTCAPPPLPQGVRRHVPDPAALAAWKFDTFWQMANVDDATLAGIPQWQAIAGAPALVQAEGDPAVWLVDAGFRRRVPSPEALAAWQFDPATIQTITPAELQAMPQGTDVRPAPFLIKGSGPEVYVLDDPQCPPGGDPDDPLCPPEAETTGGTTGSSDSGTGGGPGSGSGMSATGEDEPTSGGGGGFTGGPDGTDTDMPHPSTATAGQALPPGYGQHDGLCRVDARGNAHGSAWALLLLAGLGRRRRGAVARSG
ncbi:MAG TPA: SpoIID/LytB domain-containing protein [Nannocystis sp.]